MLSLNSLAGPQTLQLLEELSVLMIATAQLAFNETMNAAIDIRVGSEA